MRKRIVVMLLVISAVFGASADAAYIEGNTITSQGACVMDYETGDVLYEYNGYIQRPQASFSKIMTIYRIYEKIANGDFDFNTTVPISQKAAKESVNVNNQYLPLYQNEKYTVSELMDLAVVHSSNASAIALAEFADGNEQTFVTGMNETASRLGIDAVYYDSTGLGGNTISPVSMAKLSAKIISDFPDILKRSSKKTVNVHGRRYENTNLLLSSYYGVDGLKTGSTTQAGKCLCATANKDGRRMIAVTMASSTDAARFDDAKMLLDCGFRRADGKYGAVYNTDLSTVIDGCEIPTFVYRGAHGCHTAVIIEDLVSCGFDVEKTAGEIRIMRNYKKTAQPIPTDIYKHHNGRRILAVYPDTSTRVMLEGSESGDVYKTEQYTLISVDELQKPYDFLWDFEKGCGYITTCRDVDEQKPFKVGF